MNRYWLSQNGQTTGPFAEEIIHDMWKRGQVRRDAVVCLEETEDWLDVRFLVNELEAEKQRRAAPAKRYEAHAPVKKPSQAKAMGLFIAAILMGVVAWMLRGERGTPMTDDAVVFTFLATGIMVLLAICLLMVRGGMIAGLLTLIFAVLMSMGTMSRLKFEALERDTQQFERDMKRLVPGWRP